MRRRLFHTILFNGDAELVEKGRFENKDENKLFVTTRNYSSINHSTKKVLFFILISPLLLYTAIRTYGIVSGQIDDENTTQTIKDWTLVEGSSSGPAIVMLAEGGKRVKNIQHDSIEEKVVYAQEHNCTLICCNTSLDEFRLPFWSKLKLLYKVMQETNHEFLFWLDVDTVIWDRQKTIESFVSDFSGDLMVQIDLRRKMEEEYFNSGVMIVRNTERMLEVLKEAYNQYQIPLFYKLLYKYADQEALNKIISAKKSQESSSSSSILDLKPYGEIWSLPRDVRKINPFVVHFPDKKNPNHFRDFAKNAMSN